MEKTIAVICKDNKDFKQWKKENNIIGDILDSTERIILKNTIYYKILTPCDLCSLAINEVIEAKNAKQNKNYEEIIRCTKYNLIR